MRFTFSLLVATLLCLTASPLHAADKPNVILFLVDDMGWMDCGVYGSRYYQTPHIDALARRGMLFTDAYSANPLCSPTRASIMTGKYPARHGITTASGHQPPQAPGASLMPDSAPANRPVISPESRNYMEPAEYTLAEALRDAGYRTGHFGKWHLGLTQPYWPEQQGFEVAFHGKPDPGPGSSYFAPYQFRQFRSFPDGPPGEYIVDRMAAETVKFIEESHRKQQPFFVNFWSYGVHGPWGHKEEYTREFARLTDPTGRQGNPIMASMLRSVDEALGSIIAALDRLKLTDNTVILFSSDNGGNIHSNVPGGSKTKEDSANIMDWRKWAGDKPPTNNAPLRSGKSWLFEGGVRVPLIVAWPGRIAAGTRTDTLACSIDFYPTLLELTGVPRNPSQVMDGVSLAPVLRGTGKVNRDAIFNFFPHAAGNKPAGVTVRQGDWKLIRWFNTTPEFTEARELYNLRDDIGETKNLASAEPQRVQQLDALIDGFLRETHALVPKPNPAYKPNPAAAKRAATMTADPLQGWQPKSGTAEAIGGGFVRIFPEGRTAFLGKSGLDKLGATGDLVVKARLRSTGGGEVRVQWRSVDQETFPREGQIVSAAVPPGHDGEVALPLSVKGKLMHVRFYVPAGKSPVDIDSIRLESAAGKLLATWDLGGK